MNNSCELFGDDESPEIAERIMRSQREQMNQASNEGIRACGWRYGATPDYFAPNLADHIAYRF